MESPGTGVRLADSGKQPCLLIAGSKLAALADGCPVDMGFLQFLEAVPEQSGMAFDLKIANIARDGQLVQLARTEAQEIIDNDPECNAPHNALLWNRLRELKKTHINWAAIS